MNISFKTKIFLIFLIPIFVIFYFAYYFLTIKYSELERASCYKFFYQFTKSTSNLIHSLQIERGLSAGYVALKNDKYKNQLLKQEHITDLNYKNFLKYYKLEKKHQNEINKIIILKTDPKIKQVLNAFNNISKIREQILNKSISFNDIIKYYTNINKNLINTIYIFTSSISQSGIAANKIYKLEKLKEYAGLERAYIYNQLLSNKRDNKILNQIRDIIAKEEAVKNELLLDAGKICKKISKKNINQQIEKELRLYRKLFFEGKLTSEDALKWFKLATKRINNLERVSISIFDLYSKKMDDIANKAKTDMYITILLALLSIITFMVLIYILNKLIDKENELIEEIRIASYAFESHEAIMIVNNKGIILKVNRAFEEITGYKKEEVLNKHINMMKSDHHSDEFYQQVWLELKKKGKWSGEIHNVRKNGEVYIEKLSATAIKDEKGNITHYIMYFIDISDIKKAQEIIEYQATHDTLTKLFNREFLIKKLEERLKLDNYNIFIFLDLDGFKPVNDTYGHKIGDLVLIEVADVLQKNFKDAFIARFGGDEFCIVLNGDKSYENTKEIAKEVAKKIVLLISTPMNIENQTIKIGTSVGVYIFSNKEDVDNVIEKADKAMYKAKKSGKNRFVIYNDLQKE